MDDAVLVIFAGQNITIRLFLAPISRLRIQPDAMSYTVVQSTKTSEYQMLHIASVDIKI